MVILAIDLTIIAIVVFCTWRGYRNGLIRGVFGVVTLVVSLFLASVAASAYSGDFTEMLNPFVSGVVDSALVKIVEDNSENTPSEFKNKSENYIVAYKTLRRVGLSHSPAARIAEMATSSRDGNEIPYVLLSDYISNKLSSVLAFVLVFGIAFILLAIIFAVIGNLIGFVFSLPGLALLDTAAGAVFGLAKGLLIVFILSSVVRYVGLLAPETLDRTAVLKFLVNNNPIANVIGI